MRKWFFRPIRKELDEVKAELHAAVAELAMIREAFQLSEYQYIVKNKKPTRAPMKFNREHYQA